jgi:hypothetical protein
MLTEGARKIYRGRHGARGRRVGQGCCKDWDGDGYRGLAACAVAVTVWTGTGMAIEGLQRVPYLLL